MAVLYGSGNWNSDNAWTTDPDNPANEPSEKDLRPGADDEADIGTRSDKNMELTDAAGSVRNLTVHAGANLGITGGSLSVSHGAINQGGIILSAGGSLTIAGGLVNKAGARIDVVGSSTQFIVNTLSSLGDISVSGGLFRVSDTSLDTVAGSVVVSGGGILDASISSIAAGASLTVSGAFSRVGDSSGGGLGGLKSNHGTLRVTNASVSTDSRIANWDDGSIVLAAGIGKTSVLDLAHGGTNLGVLTLKGSSVIEVHSSFNNSGTLNFVGSEGVVDVFNLATISGRVGGQADFVIESKAWLTVTTALRAGSEVQFHGDGGKLFLYKTGGFHAHISDFSIGNTIDIFHKSITGLDYDDGTLLVSVHSGATLNIQLDGDFDGLAAVSDRNGGMNIVAIGPSFTLTKGSDIVDAYVDVTIRASRLTLGGRDDITVNSAGDNTLALRGGGSFDLSDISGFGHLKLKSGHDYTILAGSDTVGTGNTLKVDAANLGVGDTLVFAGTAETSGHLNVNGGAGDDTISGGHLDDRLAGGKGNDVLKGGGGHDTFIFVTGAGADTIADFNTEGSSSDVLDLSSLNSIADFNDLKNGHMSVLNGDVIIDAGNGDMIVLEGVRAGDLSASNFSF